MTIWCFPDNTVLCNFAIVNRLDILEKTLANRGRWTEAVANELRESSKVIPALAAVPRDGWLRDPIELVGEPVIRRVDVIRRTVFGGLASEPLRHLGEAQTLFLIQNDQAFRASIWITDDREAGDYARRQGIVTRDTVGVMKEGVADAILTAHEAYSVLGLIVKCGRHLRGLPQRPGDLLR
jgi:predicted nucleic acid-binding protein